MNRKFLIIIKFISSSFIITNIFEKKFKMFWQYSYFPQHFYQNLITGLNETSIPHYPLPISPNIQNQVIEQNQRQIPIERKLINLTREDLLNSGLGNFKRLWTEEQDKKLKMLIKKYEMDWQRISQQMPERNPKMCYSRYRRLLNASKNYWKKSQQEKIFELISEIGQNWKEISKQLPNRTPRQVKEHYFNYLKPDINKSDWNIEDDMQLIALINENGLNWKLIIEKMNGRTENQIKNQYFGKILKLSNKKQAQSVTITVNKSQNQISRSI